MSRRIVVGCAVVAVVLSSCGGGDSGPSEEEFRTALAEACETFNDERADLEDRKDDPGVEFLETYEDLVDELDDELAALEPPSDLEDPLEELQGLADEAKDLLREIDRALEDLDTDDLFAASDKMDDAGADTADVAEELGVEECELDFRFDLVPDDDEDADDEPAATEAPGDEFEAGLDEVCDTIAEGAAGLVSPTSDTDFAGLAEFATASRSLIVEALTALENLEPPADLAETYEEFLEVLDDQIEALEDLELAASNEDPAAINTVELALDELGRESNELADEFDLDRCATGG